MRWSCEHLIMVWINAFVMLMSQLLPPSYCDLLHRSAAHLGRWQKLEHGSYSNAPQHVWVALLYTHTRRFENGTVNGLCITVVLTCVAGGQKVPFGLRGCWYDTVDVYIRQLDPIMSLCPLMFPMQGFMWVSVFSGDSGCKLYIIHLDALRVDKIIRTPLQYNTMQYNSTTTYTAMEWKKVATATYLMS